MDGERLQSDKVRANRGSETATSRDARGDCRGCRKAAGFVENQYGGAAGDGTISFQAKRRVNGVHGGALTLHKMAASYTVIQYVPNPVIDERINVGVIVFGSGKVQTHFIQNWTRVRQFGGADIRFLKDFGRYAEELKEDAVHQMVGKWMNCIQFTEPIWAEMDHEQLLFHATGEFLIDPPLAQRMHRSRRDVVNETASVLKKAIRQRIGGRASLLVKKNRSIEGTHGPHTFDIYVGNGRPIVAAQGLSFELPEEAAERDYEAVAWTIQDTKDHAGATPQLSVVMTNSPRQQESALYRQATKTLRSLGAELISESQVMRWAERIAALVAA